MKDTFDHPDGLPFDLRPLLAMHFDAAPAIPQIGSRSTIVDIRRFSERRPSTILRPFAGVQGVATRLSPVSSAAVATPAGSTSQKTPIGSRPDGLTPPAGYERLRYRIQSASGLIMHSGRLADPLNAFAKEMRKISSKRMKTDSDFAELARLEYLGGLYLYNGEPCIPGDVFEAALIEAAKKTRRGQQAKAGLVCAESAPLEYEGPRTPADLWSDENFRLSIGVRIQKNRVIRTRPIFRKWSAVVSVDFMPGELNASDVSEMVMAAGSRVGLMDWRPRFGRFTAERQ